MRHIFVTSFVFFFFFFNPNSSLMTISCKSEISHSRFKGHKLVYNSSPHFAQSLIVLIFILSNFSSFFIFSRKHCYWLTIWKKFFMPWYQALCSDMKSGFALQEVERKGIRTICNCDNHLRKHKGNSHFLGIFLLNILEDNFPLLPVL